jgi:hypothetical protein
VLCSTGCALLGPAALRGSRSAYNDAIVATNNQQVLSMVVRMRYGEPTGLLAVSSVTANMRIQANAGAEFGIGSGGNYEGNLVPLSAGFAYEENPTISYMPVQGEKYMRQLLSPLPLDLTVLLLRALHGSPQGAALLLRSVNGIRNPEFLADPSVEVDPRFTRLVELLAELARQGRDSWAQSADPATPFVLVLTGEGDAFGAQIAELYDLLGFAAPRELDGVVTLPLRLGIGKPDEPAVHVETRSLFELFNVAAASVEVPEEHVAEGIAPALPPAGPVSGSIRIRRSKGRPDGALTATRHHGWWYFIEGSDTASKLTFRIIETLISVRIADAVDHGKATPVLTVPVSR